MAACSRRRIPPTSIRNEAGIATMCVGTITTADQVNTIIAAGRADPVALGRPHLVDPRAMARRAAAWVWRRYPAAGAIPRPVSDQLMRNTPREREELTEPGFGRCRAATPTPFIEPTSLRAQRSNPGECVRPKQRIIAEVDKDLTNHPLYEIEKTSRPDRQGRMRPARIRAGYS